ncbi:DoxX-like protein [Paenibacillus cellulosilyticus]|uniref:DoxX-like protein n=1 Tax=Paenibacillus cellulosilyticus TaxID=375489 RepID=A0A2V2YY38_9BACL|nr:DoxX family protein [Paenibacillus cellulosilyticus]PWW06534.1 DoxX-like protein [Paenibacillus cellulosilyticus]QKS46129.1 DoxX family protein [Paenibacillus cellulosilyticus]
MYIMFVILQSFLLVAMSFGGATKLTGSKNFVEMFDSLKLPQWFRVVTGIVQLAGAVGLVIGYWDREIAAWAGIWLGVTMLVAFLTHLRVKHPVGQAFPALFLTCIAAALVVVQAV